MKTEWPKVRLGEVLAERREVPATDNLLSGTIRVVEKIGFNEGLIQLRADTQTRTGMILIRPGDLVVSGINAAKGAIAIYDEVNEEPVAATIHYGAYIPNKDRVEIKFLWWMLRSKFFRELLLEYVPGGIKTELKAKRFLPIPVPLPPPAEQRRILARIEDLAATIQEARKLRQQAAEGAEALDASHTNAFFSGDEISRWPVKALEEISEIRSGVTLGRLLTGKTIRLPYLRVANVQDGCLDLSKIKEIDVLESEAEKWQLVSGDLLLTEGGDWDKLGRCAVWREEIPNCIHQNHIFRVRTNPSEFVPEFLAALISSPVGKAYFQEASKQTTNLASINQRQLKAFRVFQPPLPEQQRMLADLEILRKKRRALQALQGETSTELDALMPSILDKAFRGEL